MKAAGRGSVISTQNALASARQGAKVEPPTFFALNVISNVAFHPALHPEGRCCPLCLPEFHQILPFPSLLLFSFIAGSSPSRILDVGAFGELICILKSKVLTSFTGIWPGFVMQRLVDASALHFCSLCNCQ